MIRTAHAKFLVLLAVAALSVPLYAAQTITHQGRLLGADDKPIADGTYGATFTLWDDPVAGTQVWSEFRDVQTKSGLFSVELGQVSSFFDIFTEFADRDLYLQTQVQISGSTQTLTPRLRLGTVPSASVSRRVHALHNGSSLRSLCDFGSADSGAVSSLSVDLDGDGHPDRSIDEDCDDIASSFRMRKRPEILYQAWDDGISLHVDDASSSSVVAHDLDQDGVLDMVISSSCDATGAKHAINTKGTGAQGGRSASITASATPGGASSVCSLDRDGNGIVDVQVGEVCDDASSSRSMSFFDVFTEMSIDDDCDGISARRRLSSSNIGSSGQDGVEISSVCSPDSAVESSFVRRNGAIVAGDFSRHTPFHNSRSSSFFDVFTELSIDQDCDATGARLAINSKGTSAKRTAACSADATTSSVVASGDLDGDGLDDSEAALRISPTKSGLAIKTKGTSAQRFRGGTDCDDADAHNYLDCDDDGDGIAESSVSSSSSSSGCDFSLFARANDGTPARISTNFTVGKQTQQASFGQRCFVDGDDEPEGEVSQTVIPGTSSVAIKTKGTGADPNRSSISSSSSPSRSSVVCNQDSDGDGLADRSVTMDCDDTDGGITVEGAASKVKIRHKGWDGLIYGRMAIENAGAIQVDFGGNGVGFVSERFGVGVLSPTYPIEHSSGAHLTPGGVWTNASDANLKENFQPVDGEEILDKIDQLKISQWNYKNESDEVTHIGPTAQDFKATFGVGENDKSISTIDPSGIALVAVKELRKENQELKSQVAELKKMVEELAKKK